MGRWVGVIGCAIVLGCADPGAVASVGAAVHGGEGSALTGAGLVIDPIRCLDTGAFLGERRVLTTAGCAHGEGSRVLLPARGEGADEVELAVVEVHAQEAGAGSTGPLPLVVLVTDRVAPVTPLAMAAAPLTVGDVVRVVGYGRQGGVELSLSEGRQRVRAVSASGLSFTLEPVGDARACATDALVLDGGRRAGRAAHRWDPRGDPRRVSVGGVGGGARASGGLRRRRAGAPNPAAGGRVRRGRGAPGGGGGCAVGGRTDDTGALVLLAALSRALRRRRRADSPLSAPCGS